MSAPTTHDLIIKSITEKSVLKQDVFHNTALNFKVLKRCLKEICDELEDKISGIDDRLAIEYKDSGDYEAQVKIAGDVLIFNMHSNVFEVFVGGIGKHLHTFPEPSAVLFFFQNAIVR